MSKKSIMVEFFTHNIPRKRLKKTGTRFQNGLCSRGELGVVRLILSRLVCQKFYLFCLDDQKLYRLEKRGCVDHLGVGHIECCQKSSVNVGSGNRYTVEF